MQKKKKRKLDRLMKAVRPHVPWVPEVFLARFPVSVISGHVTRAKNL